MLLNNTVSQKPRRAWNWDGLTLTFAPGRRQHGPGMDDVTQEPGSRETIPGGVRRDHADRQRRRIEHRAAALDADLTPIGLLGCWAYTDTLLSLATLVSQPAVTFFIPLPSDPGLAGGVLFLQGAAVDPAANPGGLVTSNGLRATLGY